MPRYDDDDFNDDLDISRGRRERGAEAGARVAGPAIAMMVCAIISSVTYVGYCPFNMYIVFTQPENAMMKQEEKVGQFIGAAILVPVMAIVSAFIVFASYQMKNLNNYGMAMTAAIFSVIPCCSPCWVLGIPFGIWALIVLNDPEVKSAFTS